MIDDIFLIGKHNKYENDTLDSFKNDLNKRCKLNWITEDLSKRLTSLI